MKEYIDRITVKELFLEADMRKDYEFLGIDDIPAEDVVERGVYEQVVWERDIAIKQLEELGYELGQKVEPVVERSKIDNAIEEIETLLKGNDLGIKTMFLIG